MEVVAWAQVEDDITQPPDDHTVLSTIREAARLALERAGISVDQLATVETHDCFTIAAVLAIEALGLAEPGKGPDFILEGHTSRDGKIPFNTTGGLIGWGHPTGATGVHQAVTLWEQLTGKAASSNQISRRRRRVTRPLLASIQYRSVARICVRSFFEAASRGAMRSAPSPAP